ncbi:hypothetical protein BH23ACT5_BH23ACT5_24220 [soil metagenome]
MRSLTVAVCSVIALGACSAPVSDSTVTRASSQFPPAPASPEGPLEDSVAEALDRAWEAFPHPAPGDLTAIGDSDDPRLAWLLADFLRFVGVGEEADAAREALTALTGLEIHSPTGWVGVVNHLIAWDTPAPPDYVEYKRHVFTATDERWAPFFVSDGEAEYRWWTWGGVLIDDRGPGDSGPCSGCIPAVDDPEVDTAEGGDWYPDERLVLGVVIGDEARAYPRNILEVHEMVNDSLGGRSFALVYCTLCGSGQLYFTDDLPADTPRPVMRTSGLLTRSNKVMYDVVSGSVFDTFTGRAVTGPLWKAGVQLNQGTVITSTWGDWKAGQPDTTIVVLDGGAGRSYGLDPLGERDADGPIFPVGERDPRLDSREPVLGVVVADVPVAFPVAAARDALLGGAIVAAGGVEVSLESGGLVAASEGRVVPSHQAFWFAWSQFHPDTLLWEG